MNIIIQFLIIYIISCFAFRYLDRCITKSVGENLNEIQKYWWFIPILNTTLLITLITLLIWGLLYNLFKDIRNWILKLPFYKKTINWLLNTDLE